MHPEENKDRALIPSEGERLPMAASAKKENYWGRVAAHYSLLTRALIVILLLFTVIFLLVFSRVFTYDSLFSFVKDMQTVPSFVPSQYQTVYAMYEGGDAVATLYRGSIAFVGRGGIEIYAPDGSRLLDVARELRTPRVVASEKYLLAYDQGGVAFSVTNSYGELFRAESRFPILGATMSDSGHFALITTSDTAISRVLLYDNGFNLIESIDRGSATVSVAFPDGDSIAILGATADNGSVFAALDIYGLGETQPQVSFAFENEMPLALGFSDGTMAVLTDKALRACDTDGSVETEIPFEGTLVDFEVDANGTVLVLETDAVTATNRIIYLDDGGDLLYDGSYTGDIYRAAVGEGDFFLLGNSSIARITPRSGAVQSLAVETGATDILAVDTDGLRVIYAAKAEYVNFENS